MSDYSIAIKIAGQLEGSFSNALKSAQSGLSGLGMIGKGAGLAVKATAATMMAAGTAIAAVGAYSVNTGKEFEAAMSSTAATANATAEEYKKLEAAAMEMGRTTSKTATESAFRPAAFRSVRHGSGKDIRPCHGFHVSIGAYGEAAS